MAIREGEEKREFRNKLQNPPKPINDTSTSPEMEEYLKKMNSGELYEEEKRKRDEEKKRREKENLGFTLFCPTCRRPSLKRGPVGYSCGFCGLETNAPLRMAVSGHEVKEAEKQQEELKKKQ